MIDSSENTSLDKLKPGDRCVITRILKKGDFTRRIIDMGIRPGTEVEIERIAPLGDPIEFKIKGFHISLRKEEAENILVKLIGKDIHK